MRIKTLKEIEPLVEKIDTNSLNSVTGGGYVYATDGSYSPIMYLDNNTQIIISNNFVDNNGYGSIGDTFSFGSYGGFMGSGDEMFATIVQDNPQSYIDYTQINPWTGNYLQFGTVTMEFIGIEETGYSIYLCNTGSSTHYLTFPTGADKTPISREYVAPEPINNFTGHYKTTYYNNLTNTYMDFHEFN
ncbi:hypothetical protein [Sphingobacterium anhuiense]|uniref:hypothetical protein n=1 Tax=Sphingobacterium anhuiense TaxID=493780 RepID=UPI003C2C188F